MEDFDRVRQIVTEKGALATGNLRVVHHGNDNNIRERVGRPLVAVPAEHAGPFRSHQLGTRRECEPR